MDTLRRSWECSPADPTTSSPGSAPWLEPAPAERPGPIHRLLRPCPAQRISTSAAAYAARGDALARKLEFVGALVDFRKAAELSPEDPWSQYNLACGYCPMASSRRPDVDQARDRELAMAAFEMAVKKGWSRWNHSQADQDLSPIQRDKRFIELCKEP